MEPLFTEAERAELEARNRRFRRQELFDLLRELVWELPKRGFLLLTLPLWFIPALFWICWREEPRFRTGFCGFAISAVIWFFVGRWCGWW